MHLVAMGLSISLSSKPSLSLKRRYSASRVPAPTTITAAPAATVLEPTVKLGFEMTLGIRHYILCLKYRFTSVKSRIQYTWQENFSKIYRWYGLIIYYIFMYYVYLSCFKSMLRLCFIADWTTLKSSLTPWAPSLILSVCLMRLSRSDK